MNVQREFDLTCHRDAADDALLLDELEGRADDRLERERREHDIWGPSPDDLDLGPLPRFRFGREGQ